MKGSFLFLSCLMLLLGLCAPASAEEGSVYTVMCQNLRAPSSKELADPALSPVHRSELFKTLLAQYAPDVVGLQEAKGVWQELLESYPQDTGYGYTATVKINPDAQGYTAILYKQSRFELLEEGVFWLTDTPCAERRPGWPLDSLSLYKDGKTSFLDPNPPEWLKGGDRNLNRCIAFLKESLGLQPRSE